VGEERAEEPVLIVEDDPDARELLETILAGDGLTVRAYGSGTAASAWLEGHRPGLILLDLALPGMPGEEVAHTARRRYGQGLPILVVTGGGAARERTEQAETFVYLTKPFEIAELLAVVHALLSPEPPFGRFLTAPPTDGAGGPPTDGTGGSAPAGGDGR
jgi:DNA-binding response OmpR family regulator